MARSNSVARNEEIRSLIIRYQRLNDGKAFAKVQNYLVPLVKSVVNTSTVNDRTGLESFLYSQLLVGIRKYNTFNKAIGPLFFLRQYLYLSARTYINRYDSLMGQRGKEGSRNNKVIVCDISDPLETEYSETTTMLSDPRPTPDGMAVDNVVMTTIENILTQEETDILYAYYGMEEYPDAMDFLNAKNKAAWNRAKTEEERDILEYTFRIRKVCSELKQPRTKVENLFQSAMEKLRINSSFGEAAHSYVKEMRC